jgi:peptidoglycan hydrolase-like protein with peptidoglycan-binding domain
MTLKRIWLPSPSYSSRQGATPRILVIHTAEGSRTIESLGNWFANPANQVSSHTGADDKQNTVGEYVKPDKKAWTQANYNPAAVAIELCGFAKWTTSEWDQHPNMLQNCAQWIKEEAARFGIPITKLTASQAQSNGRGVCQHVDLGTGGGNHSDCGSGLPFDRILDMARGGGSGGTSPPSPAPPTTKAPPFPFPSSDYLGRPDGTSHWHDGHGLGHDSQVGVRPWQTQMKSRGWALAIDGIYGAQSESVATSFQREKGLSPDGLVGPQTWKATWEAPVT